MTEDRQQIENIIEASYKGKVVNTTTLSERIVGKIDRIAVDGDPRIGYNVIFVINSTRYETDLNYFMDETIIL